MNLTRRKFIKGASGIFMPALVGLSRGQVVVDPYRFATASGCTTQQFVNNAAQNGSTPVGASSITQLNANKIIPASSYTACKVTVWLIKTGSPTFNISAEFWSHDAGGDQPSALIGSGGNLVNAATVPTSETEITLDGLSVVLTNGTTYWLVIRTDATQNSSNKLDWYRNSTGVQTGNDIMSGTTVPVWSLVSASRQSKCSIYS